MFRLGSELGLSSDNRSWLVTVYTFIIFVLDAFIVFVVTALIVFALDASIVFVLNTAGVPSTTINAVTLSSSAFKRSFSAFGAAGISLSAFNDRCCPPEYDGVAGGEDDNGEDIGEDTVEDPEFSYRCLKALRTGRTTPKWLSSNAKEVSRAFWSIISKYSLQ